MAITLFLYPWDFEENDWSEEYIPFTFTNMNTDYYELIVTKQNLTNDLGTYTDNVLSKGSNLYSLFGLSVLTETMGFKPEDFYATEPSEQYEWGLNYKIRDDLFAEAKLIYRILPNESDEYGKASILFMPQITFTSPTRSDKYNFNITGTLKLDPMSYSELLSFNDGLNPFGYFFNIGYYWGASAYPLSIDKVEESKTTTGNVIFPYMLQPASNGTEPYAVNQWYAYVNGTNGSEIRVENSADYYRFWVPYILGAGFDIVFPENDVQNIPGGYNNGSDVSPFPQEPEQGAVASGMVRLYQMSSSQLIAFSNFLWATDLKDWETLINNLKQWFSNPLDSIISLTVSPVDYFYNYANDTFSTPQPSNILLAGVDTGVQGYRCGSNYKTVQLGGLDIKPYFNSFLDCNPHTKFSLYLPYIGFKDIDPDVIFSVDGTKLSIEYLCDLITGVCTANIMVEKNTNGTKLKHIIYSFTGNMNTVIPISSANMRDFLSATVGAVASTLAVAGSGGTLTPLVAGSMMAQQGLNIASQKVSIAHSGGMSLEAGMFAHQFPYLIVTRPREARAGSFRELNGLPSEVSGVLGSFAGFTQVSTVSVEINGATDDEKKEIEQLLKAGVIL